MATAAKARGHTYIGISDHSYGLRIARGISMENAARRHAEMGVLDRRWKGGFRVLAAVEGNIPFEGGVDMTMNELPQFDLALAAPHSRLRRGEDQTDRMVATVRHPGSTSWRIRGGAGGSG